jgi:hypothetical protein
MATSKPDTKTLSMHINNANNILSDMKKLKMTSKTIYYNQCMWVGPVIRCLRHYLTITIHAIASTKSI